MDWQSLTASVTHTRRYTTFIPLLILITAVAFVSLQITRSLTHPNAVTPHIPLQAYLAQQALSKKPLPLEDQASNATLGFQSILALSRNTPWRLHGLQAAAELTRLHIEIPPQPPTSPEMLDAFQKLGGPDASHPGPGSALAWMAHLNVLRYVVQSDFESALILEDDVDWDVNLREQMRNAGKAMRNLHAVDNHNQTYENEQAPYTTDWDVFWIGHCGEDVTPAVEAGNGSGEYEAWDDASVIPKHKYQGWAHNSVMLLKNGQRAVVRSHGPICTFAYAVTKAGARRVLELTGSGQSQAFDTMMSSLCRDNKLKCFSLVPEVMHEYTPHPTKDGALSSEINAQNGQGEMTKADDESLETMMGSTLNIVDSARCRAVFDERCPGKS